MTRHIKIAHSNIKTKYIKHEKIDGKYMCKVCNSTFTHSFKLKKHLLTKHDDKALEEKGLD